MSEPARDNSSKKNSNKMPLLFGILIGSIILVYLIVYSVSYFFGGNHSIYEVVSGSTQGMYEGYYTALALRDETIVTCREDGFVSFFVGDGSEVNVGQQTYVIDKTGELSDKIKQAADDKSILTSHNLMDIKNSIVDFDTVYNPDNYSDTYNFKNKLESNIMDMVNIAVFDEVSTNYSSKGSFNVVSSDISGILMHSYDGFEGMTYKDIEAKYFRKNNYSSTLIKSNTQLSSGDPVYKMITSENWNLIIKIDDLEKFQNVKLLTVEFLKDGISAECDFNTFTIAGESYGILSLSKYMVRYAADRYLQIRLIDKVQTGLRIPKTAVVEKSCYVVPADYFTKGGNSNEYGLLLKKEDGSPEFVIPDTVFSNDTQAFVSSDSFTDGQYIIKPETNEEYRIKEKGSVTGVYQVNGTVLSYKPVEILGENSIYYIIEPKTSGGIRMYDQIVQDGANEIK